MKIVRVFKRLWTHRPILRYLLHSIYFNFHYLPYKQAIKLPILVYKPHFLLLKGTVRIDSDDIYMGMIRLGFKTCSIYSNTGFTWENHGGTITFRGKCMIRNDSYLSFGAKTNVIFGDDFRNTAALKLVSYRGIIFGIKTRMGWGTLIMDTNFHSLYDMKRDVI